MSYETSQFSENGRFHTEPAKSGFVPPVGPFLPPNRFKRSVLLDQSGFNNTDR
jgi:hypothetical protein